MSTNFGPHLKAILREMCKRVGKDIPEEDKSANWAYFHKELWFHDYTWAEDEEKEFTNWLTDYLYKTKEARLELTTCISKNKKCCRDAARAFVWNYGWKQDAP